MTTTSAPFVVRETIETIFDLGAEWDDLIERSTTRTPFATWAWLEAWLATIGAESDLELLVARDPGDGRLLGAAPFHVVRRRRGGIGHRVLRLLGSGTAASDHLDLIVDRNRPEIGPLLWDRLTAGRRWDIVDLDGVDSEGALARLALRRQGDAARHAEPIPCPYLPLTGSRSDVEARWGRSHRQNIGRYARRMDREAGQAVTERLVVDRRDVAPTMDALAVMHQRIRTARGDTGAFADPVHRSFHQRAAGNFLAKGRLRLHRLDVGGRPVGVIYCFRHADSVAFYATGYDPEWSRFGPGRRIMAAAIRSAIDEGAAEFDFLRGDEDYKRAWGTELRHDLRILRPSGTRGRILWAARSLRRSFGTRS